MTELPYLQTISYFMTIYLGLSIISKDLWRQVKWHYFCVTVLWQHVSQCRCQERLDSDHVKWWDGRYHISEYVVVVECDLKCVCISARLITWNWRELTGHSSGSKGRDTGCCVFLTIYSVSQKNPPPPPRGPDIFHFFHKQLRICNRFFTHLR